MDFDDEFPVTSQFDTETTVRNKEIQRIIKFCYESRIVPYTVRDSMANALQDDFDNIGWAISIEETDEHEAICFTKIEARRNSNYQPLSRALAAQSPMTINVSSSHS